MASTDTSPSTFPQPNDFGAPFDDEDGDIIVRSSDQTDFSTFKLFLVKASPVFKSILSPKSPSPGIAESSVDRFIEVKQKDGLVVLCLPDSRDVLHSLLSTILPIPSFIPDTLELVIPVLAAAQKYEVESVLSHIRERRLPETENPLIAFCLAWRHGLMQEALAAVRSAMYMPLTIEGAGKDICVATGPSLHELVACRAKGIEASCKGLLQFRESEALGVWAKYTRAISTSCCTVSATSIPLWFEAFLTTGERNVATVNQIQFHHDLRQHIHDTSCKCCGALSAAKVYSIWAALEGDISKCMREVQNVLTFATSDDESHPPSLAENAANQSVEFSPESADVVLRSSDYVDFRAHKVVLSISSPFFREMFGLPQPALRLDSILTADGPETVDGLPIVCVAEDSQTLRSLVTALYPTLFSEPTTFDLAAHLFSALQKYEMDSTAVTIRRILVSRPGTPLINAANAFRAYALSIKYRLTEEALSTARMTLQHPMNFESYGSDVRLLPTGGALYELAQYRSRCRDAASSALADVFASYESSAWAIVQSVNTTTYDSSR